MSTQINYSFNHNELHTNHDNMKALKWGLVVQLQKLVPNLVDACIYHCCRTYLPKSVNYTNYFCVINTHTYLFDTRTYLFDTRTYLFDTRTYLFDARTYHCQCTYLHKSVIYAVVSCTWKTIRKSCQCRAHSGSPQI